MSEHPREGYRPRRRRAYRLGQAKIFWTFAETQRWTLRLEVIYGAKANLGTQLTEGPNILMVFWLHTEAQRSTLLLELIYGARPNFGTECPNMFMAFCFTLKCRGQSWGWSCYIWGKGTFWDTVPKYLSRLRWRVIPSELRLEGVATRKYFNGFFGLTVKCRGQPRCWGWYQGQGDSVPKFYWCLWKCESRFWGFL